jgi:hypothetical protein
MSGREPAVRSEDPHGLGVTSVNPMIKLGGFLILIAIFAVAAHAIGASLGPVAVRSGRGHGLMHMGGVTNLTVTRIGPPDAWSAERR